MRYDHLMERIEMQKRAFVFIYLCVVTYALSAGCEGCKAPKGACVFDIGGPATPSCTDDQTRAQCDLLGGFATFYEGRTCKQLGFDRVFSKDDLPDSMRAKLDTCSCKKRAPEVRSVFGL